MIDPKYKQASNEYASALHAMQSGVRQELHNELPELSDGIARFLKHERDPEHRNILKEGDRAGQQQGYVVLAEEERAKGFVRPVRRTYTHLKCGYETTMGQTLAETYARDPAFYSGTFCAVCRKHFPVGTDGEFVWAGTQEKVGT